MKYKALKKFNELGIENSYQGLETEVYFALQRGEVVDVKGMPAFLIDNNYVKEITEGGKNGK